MNTLQKMLPAEYHARKEISASMIKKCDPPARLKWSLDNPQPPTDAMNLGTAIDQLVFNGEHDLPVKPDGMSFATKEGKQWRSDNADKMSRLITAEQNAIAHSCRAALKMNPEVRDIMQSGESGLACVMHDPILRAGVRCLYDWVPTDCDFIADLKSVREGGSGPREFAREIVNRGYHLQAAWYLRLWNLFHSDPTDHRFRFAFVVVETAPPFLTAIHELAPEFIQAAETECLRRAEMIRDCTETGLWPGYPGITMQEKPRWMGAPEVEEFHW